MNNDIEEQLFKVRKDLNKFVEENSRLRDQIEFEAKSSADLKTAIDALKFYANEEVYEQKEGSSWETPDGNLQRGYYTEISDHDNNGDRARAALAKIATAQQAGGEK